MAQGDKSAYTSKQKRQAEHIEEGYERRGISEERAEGIAWATVNKRDGGGKQSGSGRARHSGTGSHRAGGIDSTGEGRGSSSEKRSAAAKKGWETRRQHAAH